MPSDLGHLEVTAEAVDFGGNLTVSPAVNLTVIPDPLTTIVGRVVDRNGTALADAKVLCLGFAAITNSDGRFSVPGLPTVQGDMRCSAHFNDGTQTLRGISEVVSPVRAANTDVGNIPVFETSSQGRDFWLAHQAVVIPEASISPGTQLIILSDEPANFMISSANFSYTGSVSPHSPAVVPIPDSLQITANQIVEDKGIHITSDADITALLFPGYSYSADMALAIPSHVLGTEYFAVGFQESLSARGYRNEGFSEFVIVSTQNDTHVTLIPTCTSLSGSAAGSVLNIVLNQGQTYQYLCSDQTDVTGTKITSDKPVGVLSGNACADVPLGVADCDVLSEMMFPVQILYGSEFFSAPLPGNASDLFRIMAAYDGTTVTVDQGGTQNSYQLDAGKFQELRIEPGAHFTGNKPISVTQYAVGNSQAWLGNPFQMQLLPTNAYNYTFRLYTPDNYYDGIYAMITASNTTVSSVTLNGLPVTGFQALPGGTHQYALVEVPAGQSVIRAEQPIAVYGIGFGNYKAYGYPAGF